MGGDRGGLQNAGQHRSRVVTSGGKVGEARSVPGAPANGIGSHDGGQQQADAARRC